MNIYYVKMLLFIILMHILVFPHNENYISIHYNRSLILNNTQRTTIKSRLLAQTQKHNPHYHNDPELKEIIDKMNEESIKKYQQTHEPYEQLKELVEKNGTKLTGGNGSEPMSKTEKDLFETYEEVFGEENHIMLKSGMYQNDDEKSDKSSLCECNRTNNMKVARTKGKDKYLKHLKHRCTRGICFCSVGSVFITLIGLLVAKGAAVTAVSTFSGSAKACMSSVPLYHIFDPVSLTAALQATAACATGATDMAGTAVGAATPIFTGCGFAALVLLILAVVLIILYIWLYRRRKRSLQHECKKHLCK
ncbi:stevor PIR protein, putative [Plasmodium reichenowi]|uniref:Stevor PIR protein, putative n=1 Tax=Plasmodium reichenowi TaxID=5854 RepID=A0A2P9DS89_PLARE|nr:stevor PIR protein, putative [Plasmodium reichenowi]